jgi:hypothetical protein
VRRSCTPRRWEVNPFCTARVAAQSPEWATEIILCTPPNPLPTRLGREALHRGAISPEATVTPIATRHGTAALADLPIQRIEPEGGVGAFRSTVRVETPNTSGSATTCTNGGSQMRRGSSGRGKDVLGRTCGDASGIVPTHGPLAICGVAQGRDLDLQGLDQRGLQRLLEQVLRHRESPSGLL